MRITFRNWVAEVKRLRNAGHNSEAVAAIAFGMVVGLIVVFVVGFLSFLAISGLVFLFQNSVQWGIGVVGTILLLFGIGALVWHLGRPDIQ